jgi:hypothetical protein
MVKSCFRWNFIIEKDHGIEVLHLNNKDYEKKFICFVASDNVDVDAKCIGTDNS